MPDVDGACSGAKHFVFEKTLVLKRMGWIGLDVGGANLKVASLVGDHSGSAPVLEQIAFALWKTPDLLTARLQDLLHPFFADEGQKVDGVAVTMSGELADCYAHRRDGVLAIAAAVHEAVGDAVGNAIHSEAANSVSVTFQGLRGQYFSFDQVADHWNEIAAANWVVMAGCVGRFLPDQSGVVMDIGSTTTDITPIKAGLIDVEFDAQASCSESNAVADDVRRLAEGSLVYAGVGRTPVACLIQSVDFRGGRIGLARELFATVDDCFLWLGMTGEECNLEDLHVDTADGRPRTRQASAQRLARMFCADVGGIDERLIDAVAEQTVRALASVIAEKLTDFALPSGEPDSIVAVGQGAFLLPEVLRHAAPRRFQIVALPESLDARSLTPAWAVATMAAERFLK